MANLWRRRFSFSRRGWLPLPLDHIFSNCLVYFTTNQKQATAIYFFSYFRQKTNANGSHEINKTALADTAKH